jgi:acetyl-CoA acyltransferase 2
MSAAKEIFIVAAKRTAFGTFGGKLKGFTATELATHAAKAALSAGNVPASAVDSVIVGNVAQTATDAPYMARHVGLGAGCDEASTALTVNRLCGSGFQSIINSAQEIMLGEAKLSLAGGSESMSQAPLSVYGQNVRFGHRLGSDLKMQDTLWSALTDSYTGLPMGITAEKLSEKYGISREDTDAYALSSQQRWAAAQESGKFAAEIAPMEVKGRKGMETFEVDEHPRPQTEAAGLAKLPTVFKKDGTVTAGSASGIGDGAAMLVVASGEAVKEHNLTPLARIASWGISGVDPTIMGIGPCPAVRQALARAGKTLDDMDLCEVNEAFAAQYLACEKELGLDRAKTNAQGGAIALAHPLAASGARIMTHLVHQLHVQDKNMAVGSACIGGGQGIAIVIEKA